MYKPKQPAEQRNTNRLRLDIEGRTPSIFALENQLQEAKGRRGCLVELPWTTNRMSQMFILGVQWDDKADLPVWTLYEQNGSDSTMHWSNPYNPSDLTMLYDIVCMSVAEETSAKIPEALAPPADVEPEPEKAPEPPPAPAPAAPQAAPQPMPPQGMPPPGMPPYPMQPGMPYPPMPGYPPMDPNMYPPGYGYNPYYPPMPGQHGAPPPMPGQPGVPPMPYPGAPPPGWNQYPPGAGLMPGQMPPQNMPGPGPAPMPNALASSPSKSHSSLPSQPPARPAAPSGSNVLLDYNLAKKRSKIQLGQMLMESRLIAQPMLDAALKLQELVEQGVIEPEEAPHALHEYHQKGSGIADFLSSMPVNELRKAMKVARDKNVPPAGAKPKAGPAGLNKAAMDVLVKAGVLTERDIKAALDVRAKVGGDVVQLLQSAGKLDKKTYEAAVICLPLIREGLMKFEQCAIALNYCVRSRVDFDTALDEMGWPNPRKLRKDLPL